jgi:mRNA interferase MazF
MQQGDIYWYSFREPDKRRPVLIVTRSSAASFLTSLTIAPITTTIRGIPSEVVLTEQDGMFETCAVNLDNLQTVAKAKFGGFITRLTRERMREVRRAIAFALGFDTIG